MVAFVRYKRTCSYCSWAWVAAGRDDGDAPSRCPRCQSPSFRSRPAPFFHAEELRARRPGRPLRAAGWYTDPADRYSARWWNGEHWTPRVWTDGAEAVDPNPTGLSELWAHPAHPTTAAR